MKLSSMAVGIAALVGVSFLSGAAGAATFSRFSDVPTNHWAIEDIEWAAESGFMRGLESRPSLFEPDRAVTRAELAVVTRRMMGQINASLVMLLSDAEALEEWRKPPMTLGDARNAQRRSDVNTLLNAIYQYAIDHNGDLPRGIATTKKEVCRSDAKSCTGFLDLDVLVGSYIVNMPVDPQASTTSNGSRYFVQMDVNQRITVSAPDAEGGESITVTR